MTLANLGFEDAGAASGFAEGWDVRYRSDAGFVAPFQGTTTLTALSAPNGFDAAPWSAGNVTVAANNVPDPDGNYTSAEVQETAANGFHSLVHTGFSLEPNARYRFGAHFLADGVLYFAGVRLALFGGDAVHVIVDLRTGVPTVVSAPVGDIVSVNAEVVWLPTIPAYYRVTILVKTGGGSSITANPVIIFSSDGTTLSYAGTPGEPYRVWGAFLIEGDLEDREAFARGWDCDAHVAALTAPVFALFANASINPAPVEPFESSWSNTGYRVALAGAIAASFDVAPEAVEDMEEGWSNDGYLFALTSPTVATFNGNAYENFEGGWLVSPFITSLTAPSIGRFDGPILEDYEDFEEVVLDKLFTVEVTTDLFTSQAHGFAAGTALFPQAVGGNPAAPLNRTVPVFVIASGLTADTFKVSLTAGGASIDVLDAGTGLQSFRGDPARFWNSADYNATLG